MKKHTPTLMKFWPVLLALLLVCLTALADMTLPADLTVIEAEAFLNDAGLTGTLVIPDGVTSIGRSAFEGTGVTGLVIPASVTAINSRAFADCDDLNGTVFVPETVTYLAEDAFDGTDVTSPPAHKLVSMGMAQVPEGRRIFQELTVLENLKMGYYIKRDKAEYQRKLDEMYSYFPILAERKNQIAGTLSGGEQQMLAMSRALMSSPRLLLLDEPSMGLSPLYVNTIFEMIKRVNENGTTVLLVEQNAQKALTIANRAYVLEIGKMTRTGTGAELLGDESIKKAYLGG